VIDELRYDILTGSRISDMRLIELPTIVIYLLHLLVAALKKGNIVQIPLLVWAKIGGSKLFMIEHGAGRSGALR
jgi:hypothetical protein